MALWAAGGTLPIAPCSRRWFNPATMAGPPTRDTAYRSISAWLHASTGRTVKQAVRNGPACQHDRSARQSQAAAAEPHGASSLACWMSSLWTQPGVHRAPVAACPAGRPGRPARRRQAPSVPPLRTPPPARTAQPRACPGGRGTARRSGHGTRTARPRTAQRSTGKAMRWS
jgi:hypothetical protein